ncbi:hypothetical protein [Micromonospora sp. 4G55]|uniref:hypothetical protein n=1 Tax=Micromonospora sp. 4G55 TaxID=2806102 RepID=UPI00278C55B7|nr:hypothetical protein [Micromonospora sp. 4G55]
MPRISRSLAAAGIAGLFLAGSAVAPATASPVTTGWGRPTTSDRTSPAEARRVDRVPTPKLDWYACYGYAECATTRLPLDYDQPKGATTEIALLRVKARDKQARIAASSSTRAAPAARARTSRSPRRTSSPTSCWTASTSSRRPARRRRQ